ncbi:uncharacterized protein SOCE26_085070 [Sorangium cellulosum]|uniref:Uncharacterized protein n=1 Tax=Sorangium cellulosum TaxID=56 RepID=A0A2L0F602_SORCE|nr:hypothetical protein [Sorangium cellulosum]AUX46996.1 uncharacterized protein SOCE26_085070 [Sorangium cellulosum]
MKVQHAQDLGNGHSIEIGAATWDPSDRSVRNRYQTASGGFSPHSSSEIPVDDLVPLIEFLAKHDELSIEQCAKVINALSVSILRQAGK